MPLNWVRRALVFAMLVMAWLPNSQAAEPGLISKPSNHSVEETVERFERAVKASQRLDGLHRNRPRQCSEQEWAHAEAVWLTYNSGDYLLNYVYPRHGLASFAEEATH